MQIKNNHLLIQSVWFTFVSTEYIAAPDGKTSRGSIGPKQKAKGKFCDTANFVEGNGEPYLLSEDEYDKPGVVSISTQTAKKMQFFESIVCRY